MRRGYFAFVLILFSSPGAYANVNQVLEFESRLEQKISRLVQLVDSDAHVVVKVKLKKMNVELPGVSSDFFGSASIHKIVQEDLESIEVKVMSGLTPFPEMIKKEIEAEIVIGQIKGQLKIVPLDASIPVVSRNPLRLIEQTIQRYSGTLFSLVMGTGVAVAVLMVFVGLVVLWAMSFWRSQVGRILTGFSSSQEGGRASGAAFADEAKVQAESREDAGDRIELPLRGLVELFADCYWTEEDRYARWIWDHLSGAQRESLVGEWPLAADFAKYLVGVEPLADTLHDHPYYLDPLSLRNMNQSDLAQLIRDRRDLWNLLPPVRRELLELPLAEKLSLSVVKSGAKQLDKFKEVKSAFRQLPDQAGIGRVTVEDEMAIWNDPNLVPDPLKSTIVSMVWVARLPTAERAELLNNYSAADLARCWIGPEPVLAAALEALPEKKQKLLMGYHQTIAADRKAKIFQRLSSQAVTKLVASKAGAGDEQNVA